MPVSSKRAESSTNRSSARPLTSERVFQLIHRRQAASLLIVAMLTALLAVMPAAAQPATPASAAALDNAVAWLMTQQADDGGFVGFSGETDAGTTVDVILALAAAQQAGVDVDLAPALGYLSNGDVALVYAQTGAGQAAKLVLALAAAGADPRNVNGVDPYSLAVAGLNDDTGFYGFGVFDHALVMLAMAAVGEAIPGDAIERLTSAQIEDGSWAFDGTTAVGAGDTNTTAMAIQALVAAGQTSESSVVNGLDYLRSAQLDGGGFSYQPGGGALADANSTGIVVQAIGAAGQDPASADWNDALGALIAFQNESGAFHYNPDMPDDNLFATVQAIPAVAAVALPIDGVSEATPLAA